MHTLGRIDLSRTTSWQLPEIEQERGEFVDSWAIVQHGRCGADVSAKTALSIVCGVEGRARWRPISAVRE